MTPEDLRAAHLLLLPAETDPQDVDALVFTRYPEADRDDDGTIRLGRHVTLNGPMGTDGEASTLIDAPAGYGLVYALVCPIEREDPPLPGTSHPDGLHRAFSDGMPQRAEARGIDLLVAVARRLDGAVRVSQRWGGTGVVLRPDPAVRVDLTVYSGLWLEPETLLAVIRSREPSAELALAATPWHGPPEGIVDEPPDEVTAELRPDLRVALHAAADRFDAQALDGPDELDGYAVVVGLGPDGSLGVIEVLVHAIETVVPALDGQPWAGEAIGYEVRWSYPDDRQTYLESPSGEYVAARDVASTAVGLIASAVVEATDGVLVDVDGFLVDRYDL